MSGMQSKIIQLEKENADLKEENADLKEENADLKKKLEKDKLGKATQRVAFTADGDREDGLTKKGDTLVFKRVRNNERGGYDENSGYNAASGTFVAPVAGTYSFTASVRAKADRAMAAYIRGDGGIHVWLWGTDTRTGSGTATVRLQAGGRVCVGTAYPASLFEGLCSSFSGALISPDI